MKSRRDLLMPITGTSPQCVAYRAFRPYHVITTVERIIARLPGIHANDVWEMLLGGPRPSMLAPVDRARFDAKQSLRALYELRVPLANGPRFRTVCVSVAEAEAATLGALREGGSWTTGRALDHAVSAARGAWCLHMRTTCVAVAAAALLRRLLERFYDPATVAELLASTLRRGTDGAAPSARAGRLTREAHRITNYEVADETELFARWSQSVATRGLGPEVPLERDSNVAIPVGTAAGRLCGRAQSIVEIALAERERSKELGLRGLHAVRLLIESLPFPNGAEDAALLGFDELLRGELRYQSSVVRTRREELLSASAHVLPIDCRLRGGTVQELPRDPTVSDVHMVGRPLASGWGEGELYDAERRAPGRRSCSVVASTPIWC